MTDTMASNDAPSPQPGDDHPFAADLRAANVPEEAWGWLTAHGVGSLVPKLGIRFETFSVQELVATMPVEGNQQVAGVLHGGATAALAETLGSFAAALHAAGRAHPVGVDLNITHHRSASSGRVRGVCTPTHLGRTSTNHEIAFFDERGRRIASARITNQLLTPRD